MNLFKKNIHGNLVKLKLTYVNRCQWHAHYVGRGGILSFAISAVDIALWDLRCRNGAESSLSRSFLSWDIYIISKVQLELSFQKKIPKKELFFNWGRRKAGEPLWKMLGGGSVVGEAKCYAGGIDLDFPLEKLLDNVRGYLADGHTAVKIKANVDQLLDQFILVSVQNSKANRRCIGSRWANTTLRRT